MTELSAQRSLLGELLLAVCLVGCSAQDPSSLRLEVEGMSPASGSGRDAMPVVISGTYFNLKAKHRLEDNGSLRVDDNFTAVLEPDIGDDGAVPLEQVEYVDQRTLRALIPAGMSSGVYKLEVTDPYGNTGRLSQAFTATSGAVLNGTLVASATKAVPGHNLDITLCIVNDGDEDALSIQPSTPAVQGSGGVAMVSSPSNPSASSAPNEEQCFVWTYQATDMGTVLFTSSATAISAGSEDPIALPSVSSQPIDVVECLSNADCAGGTPWCETEAGLCVTCLEDDPPWWNGDYGMRRNLTIEENAAGVLPAGYSVVALMNTEDEVIAGTMRSDGNDLRVVWFDGVSRVELDRHLVAINTTQTEIWFMTQDDIDTADDRYYLYYDNPAAGAPPAYWSDSMGAAAQSSRVYLAADHFEDTLVGAFPDGWEGSPDYRVEAEGGNQVLEVNDISTDGDYLFAGRYDWGDIVIQGRMRAVSTFPSQAYYGFYFRAEAEFDFETAWYGAYDHNTAQVYTMKLSSADATGLSPPIQEISSWSVSSVGTAWHTYEIRLAGRTAVFFLDDVEQYSWTNTGGMTQGRIGVCAGYVAAEARFDDIIVRRYVEPEPTVSLGSQDTPCR